MDPAGKEPSWEVAQVVRGGFQIAELELEAAQDTDRLDREDLVRHRRAQSARTSSTEARACSTRPRSTSRSALALPTQ